MTITRTRENGTTWQISFVSWQFVGAICAAITLVLALTTPWVRYQAGGVAEAKDSALASQIRINTMRLTAVEERATSVSLLDAQHYEDLKQDIRDLRADVRSIREILSNGRIR
jgi:hypothetical protein